MRSIEENRRQVINLLEANEYTIDEIKDQILASKYCEKKQGGVICHLVETSTPYEHLRIWGSGEPLQPEPEAVRFLAELNEKLLLLRR